MPRSAPGVLQGFWLGQRAIGEQDRDHHYRIVRGMSKKTGGSPWLEEPPCRGSKTPAVTAGRRARAEGTA